MKLTRSTPSIQHVLWFAAITAGLSYLVRLNSTGAVEHFLNLQLNAKVLVYGHNHGLPLVSLVGKSPKKATIQIPLYAGKYVASYDSLIKVKGANLLKIVRDSGHYRVVTYWGHSPEPDDSQLLKREVQVQD